MKQRNPRFLALIPVIIVVFFGLAWYLLATMQEPVLRERFVVLPGSWRNLLGAFLAAVAGIGLTAWAWGKATRPGKAVAYAVTAGTHLLLFGFVAAVFYPIVYLLAVSFNRNNTLATALPAEGNIFVRSGVWPDPSRISTIQYERILSETHLDMLHWILLGLLLLLLAAVAGVKLAARAGNMSVGRSDSLSRYLGVGIFIAVAALVVSITPANFYSINAAGERGTASSERAIILYIRNTLLVSGLTGLFAVLISSTAGYAFARMKFEGRYQTLMTFVFVQMFPGFMALVAVYWLMVRLELLNTFSGLILAYSGGAIAFSAWIFKGYLEGLSPSLEEAAMVDGATRWGAFVRVILPLSLPMLLFIFLMQFIGTYSEFILANTLLQGQENWTVGMGLRNFTTGRFDTQWGALAASAVLGSIPILLVFYSFQDSLTGDHAAGGVKG